MVRGRMPGVTTVVGIATDKPRDGKKGHSSDIVYLHMPEWTEDSEKVEGIQRDLGYFAKTIWRKA